MEIKQLKKIIKRWDSAQLSHAYRTWVVRMQDQEDQEISERFNKQIIAVLTEWSRRTGHMDIADFGRPELGMLKVMGYTVGVEGLKANARRRIIEDIIANPLPLVGNPSYMYEWGDVNSLKRINKLKKCFKGFIFGGQHARHIEALQDWQDDLEWLSKKTSRVTKDDA